jgi:hypothetical protein
LANSELVLYGRPNEAILIETHGLAGRAVEPPQGRPSSILMRSAVSTIEFLIGCGAVLAGSTAMIALGIVRMLLIVPIVIGILCGLFNGVGWLIVYWVKDESIPQAIHWCLGSFAVAFTAIVVQAMTHIASAWIGERVGRI